eukprot:TRINITY_DN5982_c0_g1_i2.p1 TRINITY_DN5982_c0_g1~~TRINITY_DN5982_c0_g1_i2.p1  ORF type:complete len:1689 (+),score=319.22 TRINITY_DN5982_c0_g1_i2:63-5129(+)
MLLPFGGDLGSWVEWQQLNMGNDPDSIRLRQTRPVILLGAWALIIIAVAEALHSQFSLWVLPRIQRLKIHLILVLLVQALLKSMVSFSHADIHKDPLEFWSVIILGVVLKMLEGYSMIFALLSMPRIIVMLGVPPFQQARLLAKAMVRRSVSVSTALQMSSSEGETDNETLKHRPADAEAMREELASMGLRLGTKCVSRAAVVLLVLVRPMCYFVSCVARMSIEDLFHKSVGVGLSPLHYRHPLEVSISVLADIGLLLAGTVLIWFAGRPHRVMLEAVWPEVDYLGFAASCASWASGAGKLVTGVLHATRYGWILFECLQVMILAGVIAYVGLFMNKEKNPLIQMAKLVQGEDGDVTDYRVGVLQGFKEFCLSLSPVRGLKAAVGTDLPGLQQNDWSSSEDSQDPEAWMTDSDAEEEVELAHSAWVKWDKCQHLPKIWPGCDYIKHPQFGELMTVIPPQRLTLAEQAAAAKGDLVLRSHWGSVFVDMFSDRVRSSALAVSCTLLVGMWLYSNDYFWDFTYNYGPQYLLFFRQLVVVIGIWVVLTVFLYGNNVFVPSSPTTLRVWSVFVMGFGAVFFFQNCRIMVEQTSFSSAGASVGSFVRIEREWLVFCFGVTGLMVAALAGSILVSLDAFTCWFRQELGALKYTRLLLTSAGNVADNRKNKLKPGEDVWLMMGGMQEQCFVREAHGDGTVSVVFPDGRQVHKVGYKYIHRKTSDKQISPEKQINEYLHTIKGLVHVTQFPTALLASVTLVISAILGFSCATMYCTRCILHKIYRSHIAAGVLNFMLWTYVVPPDHQMVMDSLKQEGQVFMDPEGAHGVNMPSLGDLRKLLYYRWDNETVPPGWPSSPCVGMYLGKEVVSFMTAKPDSTQLTLEDFRSSFEGGLAMLGLDHHSISLGGRTAMRLWDELMRNARNMSVSLDDGGPLLCEMKLVFSVPSYSMRAKRLALSLAEDFVGGVIASLTDSNKDGKLSRKEARERVLDAFNLVLPQMSQMAEDLFDQVWAVADKDEDGILEGPEVEIFGRQVLDAIRALPQIVDLLKKAVNGEEIEPADLLALLDRNSDGRLSLKGELPMLVGIVKNVCLATGCGGRHLASDMWAAITRADRNGDGFLDKGDMQELVTELVHIIAADLQKFAQFCRDENTVMELLDTNHDGVMGSDEALAAGDKVALLTPGMEAGELDAQVMAAFSQADNNKDNVLEQSEVGPFLQAIHTFCPAPAELAKALEEHLKGGLNFRRLSSRRLNVSEDMLASIENITASVEDTQQQQRLTVLEIFSQSFFGGVMLMLVNILSQGWIPIALVGVNWGLYIAVTSGNVFALYMMSRAFSKYHQLFKAMQAGQHTFDGASARDTLRSSFSQTTVLPGMIAGTSIIGWIIATTVSFIVLIVVVLLVVPAVGTIIYEEFRVKFLYIGIVFASKYLIQYMFLDGSLVEGGDVVHPRLFAPVYFVLIFIGYITGGINAVCRTVLVSLTSVVSCCFVDFTVMPEELTALDSAYWGLLSLAYTQHEAQNPIKRAFISCLMGKLVHRAHGAPPKQHDDSDSSSSSSDSEADNKKKKAVAAKEGSKALIYEAYEPPKRSAAFLRARNRFHLAVTLHNNPELRVYRRRADYTSDNVLLSEQIEKMKQQVLGAQDSLMQMASDSAVLAADGAKGLQSSLRKTIKSARKFTSGAKPASGGARSLENVAVGL